MSASVETGFEVLFVKGCGNVIQTLFQTAVMYQEICTSSE